MNAQSKEITLAPDAAVISQHLTHLTRRWGELKIATQFEVRFIKNGVSAFMYPPTPEGIQEAVKKVVQMNKKKWNAYVVVNPIKGSVDLPAGQAARDINIAASFYHFADSDSEESMDNILVFDGPDPSMRIDTGQTPFNRFHLYWELDKPAVDMNAWNTCQRAIAATLGTDKAVVNPSRVMRLAGAVSWPNDKKKGKGYVDEVTTLLVSDVPPVTQEQMQESFPLPETPEVGSGAPQSTGVMKDVNDYVAILKSASIDGEKHHAVVQLAASLYGQGCNDAFVEGMIRMHCPVWDAGVEKAIASAKAKFGKNMQQFVDHPEEDDFEVIEEDEGEAIDLTRPPGLLGDMVTASAMTSNRETRFFGLAGSLIALAAASGHKWMLKSKKHKTPLNLQIILAASTGGGKEEARDVVVKTYEALSDKTFYIGREPASDAALHQMFTNCASQVIMIDEFGQYLQSMETKSHDFKMLQTAMTIFTSADKFLPARAYASSKNNKAEVRYPYLNALHTTTPDALFSGLDRGAASSGFLGRYMMLVQGEDAPLRDADDGDAGELWQSISERLRAIADYEVMANEDLGLHDPHMYITNTDRDFRLILCDDAALAYMGRVRDAFEERRKDAPEVLKGLWSRGFEMVCRVCGIVALGCAEDLHHPIADETAARYAAALVEYTIRSVAPDVVANATEGELDGLRKSILRAVDNRTGKDGWAKHRNVMLSVKGGTRRTIDIELEIENLASRDKLGLIRMKPGGPDGPTKPYQYALTKAGRHLLNGGGRGAEILKMGEYIPLPDIR